MFKSNVEKESNKESSNSDDTDIKLKSFKTAMKDFIKDIIGTFPEFTDTLHPGLIDILEDKEDSKEIQELYNYCKTVYSPRFFDLLYQNKSIFTDEETNTEFLPGIEFKNLWKLDISENTKEVIWKYLQLICFSLINDTDNLNNFGDTTKLFEAIGENELKEKLQETISNMSKIFDNGEEENPMFNFDASGDLPNPDDLHEHISGLMNGKLGRLASQITEETLEEFQDLSDSTSVSDVFTKLFQDPGRLMRMVKKLGSSLDEKIKSGEIKESELMEEASEMMKNMKNMPGMENMQSMFEKMGMGNMAEMAGMGGKQKVNMNAMRGQLNQNIKTAKMKERMREKLRKRQEAKLKENSPQDDISILEKQLQEAKNVNSKLENIIEKKGKIKKNKKNKKRRKQKNKK
jgi:hypothetical protein